MARADSQTRSVLELLDGRRCTFCDEGELTRESFRGNRAVVCEDCGIPHAQVW